jgi:hypothetical protein
MGAAGDQLGADAPDCDGSLLLSEAGDDFLIEVIAGDDGCVVEPGGVEHLAGLLAEPCEVARVEPDASEAVALAAEFEACGDGVADSVEGIVGIDEERAVARHGVGVGGEGFWFRIERHDP